MVFEIKKAKNLDELLSLNVFDIIKSSKEYNITIGKNTSCRKYKYLYCHDSLKRVVAICIAGLGTDRNLPSHRYRNIWIDTLISIHSGCGLTLMKKMHKKIKKIFYQRDFATEDQDFYKNLAPVIYISAIKSSIGFYENLGYIELKTPLEIKNNNEVLLAKSFTKVFPARDRINYLILKENNLKELLIMGRLKVLKKYFELPEDLEYKEVYSYFMENFDSILWKNSNYSQNFKDCVKTNFFNKSN